MTDAITFTLDGREVEARPGETIWQVAKRQGIEIPHLCWLPEPGYRADGNCRACMVEIEGERVLAASCIRKPAAGMKVVTASDRARTARRMVMELLLADQPERAVAHHPESRLWQWAERMDVRGSPLPGARSAGARPQPPGDGGPPGRLHPLQSLRARLPRGPGQRRDRHGVPQRGAKIVFDMDDPMGASTCVACGECVQACPTGALMPSSIVDERGVGHPEVDRQVESVCPYCGVGCQITYHVKDDQIRYVTGRNGPANENRLCVKGRFGFDYVVHPDRLMKPLIRKEGVPKVVDDPIDPAQSLDPFSRGELGGGAGGCRARACARSAIGTARARSPASARPRARTRRPICSRSSSAPASARTTSTIARASATPSSVAALLENIGSGAVSAPFGAAMDADVIIVIGANPTENHPVAATYFKQAAKRGKTLIVMDPRGQALKRHATHMLQFKPGADVAMLNAIMHVIVEEGLYDRQYIQAHTEGFERHAPAPAGVLARGHGADLRHRGRDPAHGRAQVRHGAACHHLLGHGHQPARARHRQRPLPDLAGADDRPGRAARHRPASAARPEQRAGRLGRRPDPDDASRTTAGSPRTRCASASRSCGAPSSTPSRA